jgi:hypothetical protein
MYDLRDVIALMRHASMSTTYKPALLKSIVRLVSRGHVSPLPLDAIGAEFVTLYWNQTVVYHLRQAAVVSKEPEVLRAIRAAAERGGVRSLADLEAAERARLDQRMARILPINVLTAFHRSKPAHMPPLFTWKAGDDAIVLGDSAQAFVKLNAGALEMVANYRWARYLETVNELAPRIIEKVQRDGARRGSLQPYLDILRSTDEPACFYCGRDVTHAVNIDHVLPWSFLLDDPLWDLVLACPPCNGAKSDRLPATGFVEKLIALNTVRKTRSAAFPRVSLLPSGDRIRGLYDAAVANEWPGPWSPP